MVGAHGIGIEQDFVFSVKPLPDVHDRLRLIAAPSCKEITPPSLTRGTNRIDLQELFDLLVYLVAPGQSGDYRLSVLVLRVDPGASLRAVLVFEPSVWIRDRHAMEGLSHIIGFCWWR